MDGEKDDSDELLALLMSQKVFVILCHGSSHLTDPKTSESLNNTGNLLQGSL